MQGDIDRVFLDSINKPLPYHFMGVVSADDHCKVILSTGTSLGFTRGERVKLYHIFVPEEVYNGVIDNNTVNTSTIIVTQSEKWTTMLADIKQVIVLIPYKQEIFAGKNNCCKVWAYFLLQFIL